MEIQQTKEILEAFVNCITYQAATATKCNDPKDCDNCIYKTDNVDVFQAIDKATRILEKQIPKRTYHKWNSYVGHNDSICPTCGTPNNKFSKFCNNCGQAIYWEN